MNLRSALVLLCVTCAMPQLAQAQLGGILKRSLEKAGEVASDVKDSVSDIPTMFGNDATGTTTDFTELPATAWATEDIHSYEQSMSIDDQLCRQVVAPFNLTENARELVSQIVREDGRAMVTNLLAGESDKSTGDQVLDLAKDRAKKMNWLPMEQEIAYGRKVNQDRIDNDDQVILNTGKGKSRRSYEDAEELLQRVLENVDEEHPYTFEILLVDNNDVNAIALPGGFLQINLGVLDSPDAELVLGHEIGHVLQRHQTRETQARLIDTVETVQDVQDLLSGNTDAIQSAIEKTAALYGSFQNFSRQQELHADACSVRVVADIPNLDMLASIDAYIASLTALLPDEEATVEVAATEAATEENGVQAGTEEAVTSMLPATLFAPRSGHPDYPERKQRMLDVVADLDAEAVASG